MRSGDTTPGQRGKSQLASRRRAGRLGSEAASVTTRGDPFHPRFMLAARVCEPDTASGSVVVGYKLG